MRTKTACLAAASAAVLAGASAASASSVWIAIGTDIEFHYVQLQLMDSSTTNTGDYTWQNPAVTSIQNYAMDEAQDYSILYNTSSIVTIKLDNPLPPGGAKNNDHFGWGLFHFDGGTVDHSERLGFHAQLYDDNRSRVGNMDVWWNGDDMWLSSSWHVAAGTWTQEHVIIPLPTAGLMGLVGLGLVGVYRRRRA